MRIQTENEYDSLFSKFQTAIDENQILVFLKTGEILFRKVYFELEYNRFTDIMEGLIYGDRIKLVSEFIKQTKIEIDKEVLLNQIDRKKVALSEKLPGRIITEESDYSWGVDTLTDLGIYLYHGYKKENIKPIWRCLTPEHYENIMNIIFQFPEWLISLRQSHTPNRLYSYEMFEHTMFQKYQNGIKLFKAAQNTANEYGLIDFKIDSYLRQLRNYSSTKIIPSKKRK